MSSWDFDKYWNEGFVTLVVSITDNTIKYQTNPYLRPFEIKLKHSVKEHIPIINNYVNAIRLNQDRISACIWIWLSLFVC